MKKKAAAAALVVMCAMFIAGLVFVFSAGAMGRKAGSAAIQKNGGSMGTSQFERIVNSTTLSYQLCGLVVSLVGGLGMLASGYALYKEI